MLSNNTRPIPGLYVSREATQSDSRWLSWLGEWYGDVLVGQIGEHTTPEDTKFIGMRLGAEPLPGLDIEFVHMVQFGGAGRDESFETFLKLFTAFGDPNSSNQANQLAGIGISYTLPENIAPLRGYPPAVGEDASGIIPSCFMYLAGVEPDTEIAGVPSVLTLEAVDTRIDTTPAGFCGPNTAYRNGFYQRGNSNFGATMGVPIDTEGTSMTHMNSENWISRGLLVTTTTTKPIWRAIGSIRPVRMGSWRHSACQKPGINPRCMASVQQHGRERGLARQLYDRAAMEVAQI